MASFMLHHANAQSDDTIYLPLIANGSNGAPSPEPFACDNLPAPTALLVKMNPDLATAANIASRYGATEVTDIPQLAIHRLQFADDADIAQIQAELAADPAIRYAEPDYALCLADTPAQTPSDPRFTEQWALQKIAAPRAWDVTSGSDAIVIAIVDTGIDTTHPDLVDKLTDPATWYDYGNDDADPRDTSGHGTHVAGIAAAATNNAVGIAGIGGQTKLMPVKVFADDWGYTSTSHIVRGMLHAVDHGAHIINLSLGGSSLSRIQQEAVNYAYHSNVMVVAAAGNSDSSDENYPAALEHVIAVASTTQDDKKSSFSSYGDWVDVSAPGSGILSTYPTYDNGGGITDYATLSGTSMAAPHVAGLLALMKGAQPEWSMAQLETRLLSTVDNINSQNPDYAGKLGTGRINAYTAVRGASAPTPTNTPTGPGSPLPTPTPDGASQVTQIIGMNGKCLDVEGPNVANGTPVQIWDCVGVVNQKWTLTPAGELVDLHSGKCLDVRGPSSANGTPVQIWDCDGVANQQWIFGTDNTLQGYAGKCLTIPDGNTMNGTNVQIWDCTSEPHQKWHQIQ